MGIDSGAKAVVAAIAGWLVPGLGHIIVGHRVRGIILLVVIGVTFWGGVAIGGVKSTIQPHDRTAWFMAQACTGVHAMAVLSAARTVPDKPPWEFSEYVAYAPAEDIAVVYTGIAGLLNVLAIFDVLGRTRPADAAESAKRGPPPRGRR
jgi:hypothetical protein